MIAELSPNAQAILLLTAPLITGRGKPSIDPLTAGEYRRLARRLRELQREPADLLRLGADSLLKECWLDLDSGRLERLLGRGFLLSQAVEPLAHAGDLGREPSRCRLPPTIEEASRRGRSTSPLWLR